MSFGGLQRSFSQKCLKMLVEGKESRAKAELVEYIEYIRAKKPLYEQHSVYDNLYRHNEPDKDLAIMFIKDTLDQVSELSRGDVLTFNTLLGNRFGLDEQSTALDSAIHTLIEDKVSTFTFDRTVIAEAFRVVLEHIMSEKDTESQIQELSQKYNQFATEGIEFFSPERIVRYASKRFNDHFGPMFTEAEKQMFKKIRAAESSANLEDLFESEMKLLREDVKVFRNDPELPEDISENLDVALERLTESEVNVEALLNVFELRHQIKELR